MASLARETGPRLASLMRRLRVLDAAAEQVLAQPHLPAMARPMSAISGGARGAAERAPPAAAAPDNDDAPPNGDAALPQQQQQALVRLPVDLSGAVERFLGGGASSSSAGARRRREMSLGEAHRRLARNNNSSGAGGRWAGSKAAPAATATATTSLLRRTRSGRPRAGDVAALEDVVAERGAVELSEGDLEVYMFGPQGGGGGGSSSSSNRRISGRAKAASPGADAANPSDDPAPVYDRADAEAYALARLAPTYAACRAAMAEVAARLGGGGGGGGGGGDSPAPSSPFRPRRMLDFGAGPGTAVWAAQDVWLASDGAGHGAPDMQMRAAHAVERSAAMTALGRQLEAARAEGAAAAAAERDEARRRRLPEGFPRRPAAAPVTWAPSLAALRRRAAGGAGRRRYDLVTCAYVLSSEFGAAEARGGGGGGGGWDANGGSGSATSADADRVVRALWDMVAEGGVLLLVDPGTRAGSAAVLRARELVLDVAGRRAAKRDRRAAAAAAAEREGDAEEPEGGAYVVAPCPHDGPCPMEAAAEMAVVRLKQQQEATDEDQGDGGGTDEDDGDDAAARGGGGGGGGGGWAGAWCHFGQRLQLPAFMQRAASRGAARRTDHQVERFSYVALRRGRRPEPLPPGHLVLPPQAAAAAAAPGGGGSAATATLLFAAREGEREASRSDVGDHHHDRTEVVLDDQLLEAIDDMVPPSFGASGGGLGGGGGDEEGGGDAAVAGVGDDGGAEAGPVVPVSVGAGPGLVDRLVALDAAGVEWWRPEALDELQQQQQQQPQHHAPSAPRPPAPAATVAAASPAPPGNDADAFRQRREAQAFLLAASRSGATGWARLVRPPLKRGGHVVVDLCCAAAAAPSSSPEAAPPPSSPSSALRRPSPAPEGRLVRATVTRASLSRAWGGTTGAVAYALARATPWGAAMPLPPPPLAQGRDDGRTLD